MSETCKHNFTWTSSGTWPPHPPEFTYSICGACGTGAMWKAGAWKVGQESPGSRAIGQAEQYGIALQQIVAVLGPTTGDCAENGCDGCKHEMDEALQMAKAALGV